MKQFQIKEKSLSLSETDEFFGHLYGIEESDEKICKIESIKDFAAFLSEWFMAFEKESDNPNKRWATTYTFNEKWFHLDNYDERKSTFNKDLIAVINKCLNYCADQNNAPEWWKLFLRENSSAVDGARAFTETMLSLRKIKHHLAFHASLGWLNNYPCNFTAKELLEQQLNLRNLQEEPKALYIVTSGKTIGGKLGTLSVDELESISGFFLNQDINVMVWMNDYIDLHSSRPKSIMAIEDPRGELSKNVIRSPRCFFLIKEGSLKLVGNSKWRPGFTYKLLTALIVANYKGHKEIISKEEIEAADGWLPTISKDLTYLKRDFNISPLRSIKNGDERILDPDFRIAILSY